MGSVVQRSVSPVLRLLAVVIIGSVTACGSSGEKSPAAVLKLPDDSGIPDNLDARATAFRLFYRERLERILLAYNRFAMADDVVPATSFGLVAVAREGDHTEVVPGPNDNNPIGHAAFVAYQAYKTMGGRPLELTLIRVFEGLAFLEAVSGHPGLTCREALPGWTRIVDGVQGTVTRLRNASPVEPPVSYPASLEQEMIATFYDGVTFTYREDPFEYYYHLKPVQDLEAFAVTYVFSEPPNFLRISNCCSSWMVTKKGDWTGSYWGNHNSRDNFPDLAMGYLAAMECARDPATPPDVREAAVRAAEAGRRVGDNILAHGEALMTVAETGNYDELIPSGKVRPDGMTEWQDLGSISSCQMDYLAQALSTQGLSLPVPQLLLPGALERTWLEQALRDIGLNIKLPDTYCTAVDQAYFGKSWQGLLELRLFGMPWYQFADILSKIDPNLVPSLLGSMMDDFDELELAAVAIAYYGRIFEKPDVLQSARQTLWHLIQLQRIFAELVYGGTYMSMPGVRGDSSEMRYVAAVRARMFDLEAPVDDFQGFSRPEQANQWIESQLTLPDTADWQLLTDAEINTRIQKELSASESWIQDRYHSRFPDQPPVRRTSEGYEAIGPEGDWMTVENPHHAWFGGYSFLYEIPLCVFDTSTLDCSWAAAGCARADLDGNGKVDSSDKDLFNQAWERFGPTASNGSRLCSESNRWCDGADLTHGGRVNEEDKAFMEAAQGCAM